MRKNMSFSILIKRKFVQDDKKNLIFRAVPYNMRLQQRIHKTTD